MAGGWESAVSRRAGQPTNSSVMVHCNPHTFGCVGGAQHAPLAGLQRARSRHLARLLKLAGDARHHAHRGDEGEAGQHLRLRVGGRGQEWSIVNVRSLTWKMREGSMGDTAPNMAAKAAFDHNKHAHCNRPPA